MNGQVLSPANKKWIVEKVDEVVVLPWYVEPIDGTAISLLIDWLDKKGDKIIPDKFDTNINQIVIFCTEKQWNQAAAVLGSTIAELVQVKEIPSDVWQKAVIDTTIAITSIVAAWVDSKLKKEETVE